MIILMLGVSLEMSKIFGLVSMLRYLLVLIILDSLRLSRPARLVGMERTLGTVSVRQEPFPCSSATPMGHDMGQS